MGVIQRRKPFKNEDEITLEMNVDGVIETGLRN